MKIPKEKPLNNHAVFFFLLVFNINRASTYMEITLSCQKHKALTLWFISVIKFLLYQIWFLSGPKFYIILKPGLNIYDNL